MDNYFDHIEDYINGHLSSEDMASFKSAMSSNEELQFAVKEFQLLKDVQHVLIEEDIQASINEVQAEIAQDSQPDQSISGAKRIWLKPLSIAASVILLLGAGYFVLQGLTDTVSSEELIALSGVELHQRYFRAPVGRQVRGDAEIEQNDPQKPCDIAHQLMAEHKYGDALDTFKYSLDDTDQMCKWKSEFYSALIYAIQGDTKQSKLALNPIIKNPDHGYYKKANDLLLDLR